MLITKRFTFDSAHKLINYKGKCKNLHGHTYTLSVTVKGRMDKKSGMIIDLHTINDIVKSRVINILDHNFLNEFIKQPTAENIVIWVWDQLEKYLNLYKIEISETPDSYITYYGKKNENC